VSDVVTTDISQEMIYCLRIIFMSPIYGSRFYVPLDTKWVILDTLFLAILLKIVAHYVRYASPV